MGQSGPNILYFILRTNIVECASGHWRVRLIRIQLRSILLFLVVQIRINWGLISILLLVMQGFVAVQLFQHLHNSIFSFRWR